MIADTRWATRLDDQVAVVTGGSEGLSRAIGSALAQAGAQVVFASRRGQACEHAAEEIRSAGYQALRSAAT